MSECLVLEWPRLVFLGSDKYQELSAADKKSRDAEVDAQRKKISDIITKIETNASTDLCVVKCRLNAADADGDGKVARLALSLTPQWLPQKMILMTICLCIVPDSTCSHSHTLTIYYTCCYDEIKGPQDQDLCSCSFSDSLSHYCLHSHSHNHYLLHLLLWWDQRNSRPQDMFACSFSQILSVSLTLSLSPSLVLYRTNCSSCRQWDNHTIAATIQLIDTADQRYARQSMQLYRCSCIDACCIDAAVSVHAVSVHAVSVHAVSVHAVSVHAVLMQLYWCSCDWSRALDCIDVWTCEQLKLGIAGKCT